MEKDPSNVTDEKALKALQLAKDELTQHYRHIDFSNYKEPHNGLTISQVCSNAIFQAEAEPSYGEWLGFEIMAWINQGEQK